MFCYFNSHESFLHDDWPVCRKDSDRIRPNNVRGVVGTCSREIIETIKQILGWESDDLRKIVTSHDRKWNP